VSKVLCFDPSGNHAEGNGTTGWAVFIDGQLTNFGEIKASDYSRAEAYWSAHAQLIHNLKPTVVVYETYRLRAGKAMEQSWSQLETPQLIGVIRYAAFRYGSDCVGQDPSLKERFKDHILIHLGIAEKSDGGRMYIMGRQTNVHMRDAIRHGLYFHRFGKGKEYARKAQN
jgi:hypothetical protein